MSRWETIRTTIFDGQLPVAFDVAHDQGHASTTHVGVDSARDHRRFTKRERQRVVRALVAPCSPSACTRSSEGFYLNVKRRRWRRFAVSACACTRSVSTVSWTSPRCANRTKTARRLPPWRVSTNSFEARRRASARVHPRRRRRRRLRVRQSERAPGRTDDRSRDGRTVPASGSTVRALGRRRLASLPRPAPRRRPSHRPPSPSAQSLRGARRTPETAITTRPERGRAHDRPRPRRRRRRVHEASDFRVRAAAAVSKVAVSKAAVAAVDTAVADAVFPFPDARDRSTRDAFARGRSFIIHSSFADDSPRHEI